MKIPDDSLQTDIRRSKLSVFNPGRIFTKNISADNSPRGLDPQLFDSLDDLVGFNLKGKSGADLMRTRDNRILIKRDPEDLNLELALLKYKPVVEPIKENTHTFKLPVICFYIINNVSYSIILNLESSQ